MPEPFTAADPGSPFSLAGRRALVTGGGTGIGRAVAGCLAAAGAAVVVAGRRPEPLAEAAAALSRPDAPVVALTGDVSKPSAAAELVAEASAAIGPIDVAVTAAGGQTRGAAVDQPDEAWNEVIAAHLLGAASVARAVAAGLMARDAPGSVVMIGSLAARIGLPDIAPYVAAKGAVTALARALAVEWAPHGIRVNTITPGWIDAGLAPIAFAADPARGERVLARTPLGRLGRPEEIGWAVVYLCSAAASFVTGADLVIDGGASIAL